MSLVSPVLVGAKQYNLLCTEATSKASNDVSPVRSSNSSIKDITPTRLFLKSPQKHASRQLVISSPSRSTLGAESPPFSRYGVDASLTHPNHVKNRPSPPENVQRNNIAAQLPSNRGYFGLSYQDHNYVQPMPCTPPQSPPMQQKRITKQSSHINIDNVSEETTVVTTIISPKPPVDDNITRCICDFQHDDGYMICCDNCGVWQHVDCMCDRQNMPENYMCEECEPRNVDKHRAIEIQTKKREEEVALRPVDSSATETEDETTHGQQRSSDKSPSRRDSRENSNSSANGLLRKKRLQKTRTRDEQMKRARRLKWQQQPSKKNKDQTTGYMKKEKIRKSLVRSLPLTQEDVVDDIIKKVVERDEKPDIPPSAILTDDVSPDALHSCYTPELQSLLANIRYNGQQNGSFWSTALDPPHPLFTPPATASAISEQLMQQPLCQVVQLSNGRMGLEAREDIITHRPLMEYVGKVMLRDQYDSANPASHRSWEPHILYYSKLGGLDLCIDATTYGNGARHIRRSCTPNAEIRHTLDGSTLRFFIHAIKSIICGAEITIAFDFNYHKCGFPVECACTRASCPVVKFQRREGSIQPGSARRARGAKSLETRLSIEHATALSPKKATNKQKLLSPTRVSFDQSTSDMETAAVATPKPDHPVTNGLSNPQPSKIDHHYQFRPASPFSLSPIRHRRYSTSSSKAGAAAADHEAHRSSPPISANLSPSDGEDKEHSKKKTREEKKLEAVLKVFERMEKKEKRKEGVTRQESVTKKDKKHSREKDEIKGDLDRSADTIGVEGLLALATSVNPIDPSLNHTSSTYEPFSPVKQEHKVKKSRHGSTGSRRSIRSSSMSVGTSGGYRITPASNEEKIHSFTSTLSQQPCAMSPRGDVITAAPGSLITSTPISSTASFPSSNSSDRVAGVPKKFQMKGQDLQRQLSMKIDPLEIDCSRNSNGFNEFVDSVPSPHSMSLGMLQRRSSLSVVTSSSNCSAVPPAQPLTPLIDSDGKGCSAKKRWLTRAMGQTTVCETTVSQTTSTDTAGTPLKKRLIARESVSIDSPLLITSSSSLPGITEEASNNCVEVDSKSTTFAPSTTTDAPSTTTVAPSTATVAPWTTTVAPSTAMPIYESISDDESSQSVDVRCTQLNYLHRPEVAHLHRDDVQALLFQGSMLHVSTQQTTAPMISSQNLNSDQFTSDWMKPGHAVPITTISSSVQLNCPSGIYEVVRPKSDYYSNCIAVDSRRLTNIPAFHAGLKSRANVELESDTNVAELPADPCETRNQSIIERLHAPASNFKEIIAYSETNRTIARDSISRDFETRIETNASASVAENGQSAVYSNFGLPKYGKKKWQQMSSCPPVSSSAPSVHVEDTHRGNAVVQSTTGNIFFKLNSREPAGIAEFKHAANMFDDLPTRKLDNQETADSRNSNSGHFNAEASTPAVADIADPSFYGSRIDRLRASSSCSDLEDSANAGCIYSDLSSEQELSDSCRSDQNFSDHKLTVSSPVYYRNYVNGQTAVNTSDHERSLHCSSSELRNSSISRSVPKPSSDVTDERMSVGPDETGAEFASQQNAPFLSKKKVSLVEYRSRMVQRGTNGGTPITSPVKQSRSGSSVESETAESHSLLSKCGSEANVIVNERETEDKARSEILLEASRLPVSEKLNSLHDCLSPRLDRDNLSIQGSYDDPITSETKLNLELNASPVNCVDCVNDGIQNDDSVDSGLQNSVSRSKTDDSVESLSVLSSGQLR